MKLFGNRQRIDAQLISIWMFSVRSTDDIAILNSLRKQVQQILFEEITRHVQFSESEADGQIAYLLVHFISGRAVLPTFADVLNLDPESARRAESLFKELKSNPPPSSRFESASVDLCCLEVANETIEGRYENAQRLVNDAIQRWPGYAEFWRQRGILHLTQKDFLSAFRDLDHARALSPRLTWVIEPLHCASMNVRDSDPLLDPNVRYTAVGSGLQLAKEFLKDRKIIPYMPAIEKRMGLSKPFRSRSNTCLEFLEEQGYAAELDAPEGGIVSMITFKVDDQVYYWRVFEKNDPCYFELSFTLGSTEEHQREHAMSISNLINARWKAVKTYMDDEGWCFVESGQHLLGDEDFRESFGRTLNLVNLVRDDWYKEYDAEGEGKLDIRHR